MRFESLSIKGAYIIHLNPFQDQRGLFERLFCQEHLKEIGFNEQLKQVNFSHSVKKNTIRGLHYQRAPFSEIKIIRCIEGAFFDVIVDVRKNSPTFLQYFSIKLTPDVHQMLFIPKGCAHGFQTLSNDAKMIYFHTENYSPESEAGLHYADPILGIEWPNKPSHISEKDKTRNLIDNNFKGIEI